MRLTIAALALCCALAAAAPAMAKPLRLASTKLTYQDRSTYPTLVQEAVRLWNAAGTPVRIRPAKRGRAADVVFVTKPKLVHQGQPVAGLGGIHFTKRRKLYGLVQLSSAALGTGATVTAVDIAAHELGHALGLPHSIARCTLMFPVGDMIRALCPSSSDTYRCGPQKPDAAALARLYRGRLAWPADGGLCRPAGSVEFLEPQDAVAVSGSFVRVAVRNNGPRTWAQDDIGLTFTDAAGERAPSGCGEESLQTAPEETTVAPGEVGHFGLFLCARAGQTQVVTVRMLDGQTDTLFGPVRSFTAQLSQ